MRKVTKTVCGAFMRHESAKCGNTHTDGVRLFLHGNAIAEWQADGSLWVTSAGWQTPTTKDRLNGLSGVRVHSQHWLWFLNGKRWDGGWVQVSGSATRELQVQAAQAHTRAKADLFE